MGGKGSRTDRGRRAGRGRKEMRDAIIHGMPTSPLPSAPCPSFCPGSFIHQASPGKGMRSRHLGIHPLSHLLLPHPTPLRWPLARACARASRTQIMTLHVVTHIIPSRAIFRVWLPTPLLPPPFTRCPISCSLTPPLSDGPWQGHALSPIHADPDTPYFCPHYSIPRHPLVPPASTSPSVPVPTPLPQSSYILYVACIRWSWQGHALAPLAHRM